MKSKDYIEKWKNRSENDLAQKTAFIKKVKASLESDKADALALHAANEVSKQINCLDCGNCCRTSVTDFNSSDIKRVAKHLGMSKKTFIKKYLMEDLDGAYVTITSPCPFLNLNDNTCAIYEVRPEVCASYPHVHRSGFIPRAHAHIANLTMCPITYNVVERMQEL